MDRRTVLAAILVAALVQPSPASDELPPGARLRFGDTRFLAGGIVEHLEFSADARQLTAWTAPNGPRESRWKTAWDCVAWEPVRNRDDVQLAGAVVRFHTANIPNSTRGVIVGTDGVAVVRDYATGTDLARLNGHHARITAVAVAANGTRIATASRDGLVRVWDANTLRPLNTPNGHTAIVRSVQISPDGRTVLTCARDGTARLWDLGSGRELRAFAAGECAAAFTADGTAVRLPEPHRIVVRDLATGLEITSRIEPRADLRMAATQFCELAGRSVALSPDGRTMAIGRTSGEIQLYETISGEPRRWLGHPGGCCDLCYTPDGRTLLSAGGDHCAIAWSVRVQDVQLPVELQRETSAVKLWDYMTVGNAGLAAAAMARLATDPAAVVRMARLRLQPTAVLNPVAEVRAIELLEAIGTADARNFLKVLAAGDASQLRAREAKAALGRLRS